MERFQLRHHFLPPYLDVFLSDCSSRPAAQLMQNPKINDMQLQTRPCKDRKHQYFKSTFQLIQQYLLSIIYNMC